MSDEEELHFLTPETRLSNLTKYAYDIKYVNFDIQSYLRILRNMINLMNAHDQANRKEEAYVLATRFAVIYLEHISKQVSVSRQCDFREWDARCQMVLTKAESLKNQIRSRYQLEYEDRLNVLLKKKNEESAKAEQEAYEAEQARLQQQKRASVLGQLVPKSTLPKIGDTTATTVLPSAPPFTPSIDYPSNEVKVDDRPSPTSVSLPVIDRSLKPMFAKTNEHGWSSLRISPQLAHRFLQLADSNTKSNRETCGSLCGLFVKGEYQITALVIPKQSGTSDSCTTYKEEELFEFTDKHGLIVLGWIHTHPSQTAFLSSVDQHSQVSYQVMLPEAIAIVCAPKYDEIKTFSLTPQQGIPYVLNCKQAGFHPHTAETASIYELSQHVINDPAITFTVVDLR